MKLYEIIKKTEEFCPPCLAYEWDNVGLLAGDINKDVNKALLTLDIDINTVKKAAAENADVIISHHPLFFKGIKKIDYSAADGQIIKTLINNDIAVYAAHTNMDVAEYGINHVLAEKIGLCNTEILDKKTGLGRTGFLKKKTTLREFSKNVMDALSADGIRITGDPDRIILKAAVASGSCSEVIPEAIAQQCDAVITGDIKYHEAIDFTQAGICIIDAGHYYTEYFVKEIFADILKDCNIELCFSDSKDIFHYMKK